MKIKKSEVFLGIGSNLGNRYNNIAKAISLLNAIPSITVKKTSSLHNTKPVGGPPTGQRDFLNGAIMLKTSLSAIELLKELKQIEKKLSRKKTIKNGPRTIDLDILFYGDKVINDRNLKVPHPRMFEREFVLQPLKEII